MGGLRTVCGAAPLSPVPTRTNLAPNPAFRSTTGGVLEVRRNYATNPTAQTTANVVRTNLCPNPSFTVSTSSWTFSGVSLTRVNDATKGWVCEVAATSTSSITAALAIVDLQANQTYTISADVMVPSASAGIITGLRALTFHTSTGVTGSTSDVKALVADGNWRRLSFTVTPSAAGNRFYLDLEGSIAVGAKAYLDNVLIEQASTPGPFFDGATAAANGYTYAWTGGANDSSSTSTGPVEVYRNLWDNPRMVGAGTIANGMQAYNYMGATGTYSLSGGVQTLSNVALPVNGRFGFYKGVVLTRQVGKWTISVDYTLAGIAAGGAVSLYVDLSSGGTWKASTSVSGSSASGTLTVTINDAAGDYDMATIYMWVKTDATTPQSGVTATFTKPRMVAGELTPAYFDGATTAADGLTYSWTGTADASQSIATGYQPVQAGNVNGGPRWQSTDAPTGFTRSVGYVTTAATYQGLTMHQLPVVTGDIVTVSVWVKSTGRVTLQLGGAGQISNGATRHTGGGGWERLTHTVTVTDAMGTNCNVWVLTEANAGVYPPIGTQLRATGLLIEKGVSAVLPYFDGATAGKDGITYQWSGTANGSASQAIGQAITGLTGTGYRNGSTVVVYAKGSPQANNDTNASVGGDIGALRLGMVPGRTYTASATGNASAADAGEHSRSRRIVVFTKAPGATGYKEWASAAVPVGTDARVSVTFTVPDGAPEAFVRLYNGSAGMARTVTWREFLLEEAATAGTYFDGATQPETGKRYRWAGDPNGSVSEQLAEVPLSVLDLDGVTWRSVRHLEPRRNFVQNPAFRTSTGTTEVRRNKATNPAFKTTSGTVDVRKNFVLNPGFRATTGTVEVRRNLVNDPSMRNTAGTSEFRRNYFDNPQFKSTTGTGDAKRNLVTNPKMATSTATVELERNVALNPAMRATDASTAVRKNYIANPCGRVNTTQVGLIGSNAVTVTRVTDATAPQGGSHLRATVNSAGVSNGIGAYTIDSLPAGDYVGSYWVRCSVAVTQWQSYFQGTATKTAYSVQHGALAANTWTRFSVAFKVTAAGTVQVGGYVPNDSLPAGTTIDITGVMLNDGTGLQPYFDGASAAAGDFTYAWSGTADASTSEERALPVKEFTHFQGKYRPWQTAYGPDKAARFRLINGQTSQGFFRNNGYAATAGQKSTATYWVYLSGRARNVRIDMGWRDAANAYITGVTGNQGPSTLVPSGVLTAVRFTGPAAPANTAWVEPIIRFTDADANETDEVLIYRALVTNSEYAGPYFDGSTAAVERRNLHLNPNVGGGSTSSWGAHGGVGGNGTATYETSGGWNGSSFVRMTWTQAPTSKTGGGLYAHGAAARPGVVYTASFYVRSNVAQTILPTIEWKNAAGGAAGGNIAGPTVTLTPGQWTRISVVGATAPANTASLTLTAYMTAASTLWAVGDTLDADGALVEESATLGTYFDGSTAAADNKTYAWAGTANASVSTQTNVDLTYWWTGTADASASAFMVSTVDTIQSSRGVLYRTKDRPYVGTYAGRLYINQTDKWDGAQRIVPVYTGVTAGQLISVAAWVRSSRGSRMSIQMSFTDVNGQGVAYTAPPTVAAPAPDSAWTELRIEATAPTGAVNVYAWIGLQNTANDPTPAYGETIDVGGIVMMDGSYKGPYFDGATAAGDGLTYSWAGSVDASASIATGKTPRNVGRSVDKGRGAVWQGADGASMNIESRGNTYTVAVLTLGSALTYQTPRVSISYVATADQDCTIAHFPSFSGQVAERVYGSQALKAGVPTRVTFTATNPGTGTSGVLNLSLGFHPPGSNGTAFYGRVKIEKLVVTTDATPSEWFDGATPLALRTNLLTDPSVEGVLGWSSNNSAHWTAAYDTTVKRSGTRSRRSDVVSTTGTASLLSLYAVGHDFGTRIAVSAGKTYTFSVYLRPGVTKATRGRTSIVFQDANKASWAGSTIYGTWTPLVYGDWTRVTMTVTAPAGAAYLYTGAEMGTTDGSQLAIGDCGWADDAQLEEGSAATAYFDGSTAATDTAAYAWTGTANASSSYELPVGSTVAWVGTADASESVVRLANALPQWVSYSGTKAPVQVSNGTGFKLRAWGSDSHSVPRISLTSLTDVTAGVAYTISAKVRVVGTGHLVNQGYIALRFVGSVTPETNVVAQDTWAPDGNGWMTLKVTGTAPADSTGKAQINVGVSNTGVNFPSTAALEVADVLVEKGAAVLPFFDGTTAAADGLTYSWSGVANASPAIATGKKVTGWDPNSDMAIWQAADGKSMRALILGATAACYQTAYLPAAINEVWTHSLTAESDSPTATAYMRSSAYPVSGGAMATIRSTSTTINGRVRLSLSHTMPIDTAGTRTIFVGETVGNTFTLRDVLAEKAAAALPYFDGAMVGGATRRNLSVNPSAGAGTSWWTAHPAGGAVTLARITGSGGPVADTALRVAWTADATQDAGGIYHGASSSTAWPVTVGVSYVASGYVRSSKAQLMQARLFFYDAAGGYLGGSTGTPVLLAANAWTRLDAPAMAAPVGAVRSMVVFYGATGTGFARWVTGDTLDAQGCLIEEATALGSFFDGATAAAAGLTYGWAGTALASQSYEVPAAFTTAWSGTVDASASVVRAAKPVGVDWHPNGGASWQSQRYTPAGRYSVAVAANLWGNNDSFSGVAVGTLSPGKTYVLSGTLTMTAPQTGTPNASARGFRVTWGGVSQSLTTIQAAPNTAGTYRVIQKFTAPATGSLDFLRVYNGGSVGDPTVYWSDIVIEEVCELGTYFDGDTAAADGLTYSWAGVAHASEAVVTGKAVNQYGGTAGVKFWQGTDGKSMRALVIQPNNATVWVGGFTIPAVGGELWSHSLEIESSDAGAKATALFDWYDDKGWINQGYGAQTAIAGRALVKVDGWAAPPTTAKVVPMFSLQGPAGTSFTIRKWIAERARTVGAYFDGSMLRKNLVTGAYQWYSLGNGTTVTPNVVVGGKTWTRIYYPATGYGARLLVALADLEQGEWYTVSLTVRNEGTASAFVFPEWCDGGGGGYTLQPGETKRVSATWLPAAGYSSVYRFADLEHGNVESTVLVTDVQVERGKVPTPYFTGSFTGDEDYRYSWEGTVDASVSVATP